MRLIFIALFIVSGLYAQDEKYDKIRALRTAYITEELSLSPMEAEKFWPIYNEYDDKLLAIRKNRRNSILETIRDGVDSMTNEEANMVLDESLAIQIAELEYRKELIKKLKKVLDPRKIVALSRAENNFKRKLLKQYRGQKRNKD
ncbi:hypothetical protein [Cochleicola gelatinilyticus]|uniref:Sensor of ECF-type sigma factor n=1 Tax=Cochleicola gelatinilyticus TaxID=1763537 RepID=A0A167H4H5_9FLAO|nr:hypothetical protein [Cochleicola gelatinilyticus]OAB78207.1 hypothetical protein ULVI_12075 [Cochleicola gelatinilyticus]